MHHSVLIKLASSSIKVNTIEAFSLSDLALNTALWDVCGITFIMGET